MNKIHKILIVTIVILFVLTGLVLLNNNQTRNQTRHTSTTREDTAMTEDPPPVHADPLSKAIAEEFAKKYTRPVEDIHLTVEKQIETHAAGSVVMRNSFGSAPWFAVRINGRWKLVHDGQEAISCELAEQYNFPKDIVNACFDEKTQTSVLR